MTIPGLYEWPGTFEHDFQVKFDAGTFGCAVWQWGQFNGNVQCWQAGSPGDVTLNPSDCRDFVGYGPNTPVDLVYPAEGATIEDYIMVGDLNPAPDYVMVFFSASDTEGPQGYYTGCETPNTVGGPRSGGCQGWYDADVVRTMESASDLGTFDGSVLEPPSELAYDGSEEGSKLWPFGRLGDAIVDVSYSGTLQPAALTHSMTTTYRVHLRLFWEVEPQEPTVGNSTITIGTLVRGVRRRVVTPA